MKTSKTWLILGGSTGLGPAAVKYLRTHNQVVVDTKPLSVPLDFVINNSNYHLFSQGKPDIESNISLTMALQRTLLTCLKPEGD